MGLEEFAGSLLQALVVDGVVDFAFQTQKIFDIIVLI